MCHFKYLKHFLWFSSFKIRLLRKYELHRTVRRKMVYKMAIFMRKRNEAVNFKKSLEVIKSRINTEGNSEAQIADDRSPP